jgi:hypothetical protein
MKVHLVTSDADTVAELMKLAYLYPPGEKMPKGRSYKEMADFWQTQAEIWKAKYDDLLTSIEKV